MQLRVIVLLTVIFCFACNGDKFSKSISERKAEEQNEKNPISKGRYLCYVGLPAGKPNAPELYILSNNMYQVNDTIGHYKYRAKNAEIEWIDGPLFKPKESWVGFYITKGTSAEGKPLESMIEIQAQVKGDSSWPKVMHCDCTEFE